MQIDESIKTYIENNLLPNCSLVGMTIKENKSRKPTDPAAYLDVTFKNEKGQQIVSRYNYLKLLRLVQKDA